MRRLLMTSCVIAALCAAVHAQTPPPSSRGQQGQQGQQPPPATRPSQTAPAALPGQAPPSGEVPVLPAPSAQTPRPQGQQGRQGQPPPGTTAPVAPQQAPPQYTWQNIKLDLTITDTGSTGAPVRKVLVLHIADGRSGQVRSQGEQGLINVDAHPQVRPDGKTILLQLSVEYRPDARGTLFTESLSTMVVDGKPLVLSQTVDPSGDRKVSVEVVATIQKN
jgi:hypothetical protein